MLACLQTEEDGGNLKQTRGAWIGAGGRRKKKEGRNGGKKERNSLSVSSAFDLPSVFLLGGGLVPDQLDCTLFV